MSLKNKPYGSGIFGSWIKDDFELPAYQYTLDQTVPDPGIAYLTSKEVKDKSTIKVAKTLIRRRNWHLVGNDNVIGLAVNNNTFQVFSGERGAKYLNEYAPKFKAYSGGFGFVKDGEKKWSMIYSPKTGVNYKERTFGIGYFKKQAEKDQLEVEELVYSPFGKDTVVIIEVTLKNNSTSKKNVSYYHYWDVFFTSLSMGGNLYSNKGRFSGFFVNVNPFSDNKGLYAEHAYKRWWHPRPPKEEPSPVDFYPPIVFLKLIGNDSVDSFETKKSRFFQKKSNVDEGFGLEWCETLTSLPLKKSRGAEQKGLMVLEKKVDLEPGESRTLKFIYGYVFLKEKELSDQATQDKINDLIQKYENKDSNALESSINSWKNYLIQFTGDFEDYVSREQIWHSYYLRAGACYQEYFNNYTIQQGGVYTYLNGANIALRDPLQHGLPMVYLYPEFAKEIILYTLKCVKEDKEIPYGILGNGFWTRFVFYPSDAELYLFLLTTEYFFATRDTSIFEEIVSYYPKSCSKNSSVKERLIECFGHLLNNIGVGTHQLIRMCQGDWNDMIIMSDSWKYMFSTIQYGESTLNTAIASYVLEKLAQLFEALDGDRNQFANGIREFQNQLTEALRKEWNGQWFNRGYNGLGNILGKEELYLDLQPWGIIGNVTSEEQKNVLAENLFNYLSKPSNIGAISFWNPKEKTKSIQKLETEGTGTNGGIWYSLNMPLIWAYSQVNVNHAWEEYKRIHLAIRAEKYPNIWESILSGCDSHNSFLSEKNKALANRPGKCQPMMDKFPVMVMHSCATPLFSTIKLAGIECNKEGFIFSPKIINRGNFYLKTELIEIGKKDHFIIGKYKNKFSENGKMNVKIDALAFFKSLGNGVLQKKNIKVELNEKLFDNFNAQDGVISFDLNFHDKNEIFEWKISIKGADSNDIRD